MHPDKVTLKEADVALVIVTTTSQSALNLALSKDHAVRHNLSDHLGQIYFYGFVASDGFKRAHSLRTQLLTVSLPTANLEQIRIVEV